MRPETYDNLKTASTRLDEFIAHFRESAGFSWYEERLEEIVRDTRGDETTLLWLEDRKRAGKLIDPATAKVYFEFTGPDVYGVWKMPSEYVGRTYFARSPGSDIWVAFDDLPEETVQAIEARIAAGDFS